MRTSATTGYSGSSTLAGWALALVYSVHSYITILMPRTDKFSALREQFRSWHYLLGLVLFGLLLWRLWLWYREPRPAAPAGITPAGHAWARQLTVTIYTVLAVMPVLGIVSAWTDGLTVRLGPLFQLPALIHENRPVWMFTGYFHSALSFGVLVLTLTAVLTGLWFKLRRGVGLLAGFPPGFGVQAWISLGITVYAFSSFQGPRPGLVALATYLLLSALVWALGEAIHRRRLPVSRVGTAGFGVRAASLLACLVLLVIAGYGPYAMFRVVPWPMGPAIEAPEGVTSHPEPVTRVTVTPETPFEKEVNERVFKWCAFCHTFGRNEKHLAGPNLYAIFGQKAGTVPNFNYSEVMAEAGRNGLVWTDETMDAFLADPDAFMPGTRMIISIGPVRDPEERKAVINLLKKATMEGAY
jgi:cytochrome c2/cytochrome b561